MNIAEVVSDLINSHIGESYKYHKIKAIFEKELLQQVLDKFKYNKRGAARFLGISRHRLDRKLKNYFGNKYDRGDINFDV